MVDDEPDIALITGHLLRMEGFEVDYFTNPHAAFEHFTKIADQYSVVVCDIRMPDINGIELVTAMHEQHPDTNFIFITAFDVSQEDIPSFMDREDIIRKPFLGKRLCKRVFERVALKH